MLYFEMQGNVDYRRQALISIWCHEHPIKKFSHRQRWTLIGNTSISNFYGTCNGTVDILIYWLLFVCIKPRWTFVSPVSVVRWWLIGQFCGTFVDKCQRPLVFLLNLFSIAGRCLFFNFFNVLHVRTDLSPSVGKVVTSELPS